MEERDARKLVVDTGIELLEEGLLVRTWGNISCRLDAEHMLITPSGLDYRSMKEEDLPIYEPATGEWTGPCKPSSEKGIHAAAYRIFPEANFVIHTHQAYASAIAVYGIAELDISPEEHRLLGDLGRADYGLPGTKTLKKAVEATMKVGCHTILMANHGVVIAAESKETAIERAILLEEICRRNCRGRGDAAAATIPGRMENALKYVRKEYPLARAVTDEAVILQAAEGMPIRAKLDDMAQMIGGQVPVVRRSGAMMRTLAKCPAVLIPGAGAIVVGKDEDDTEALQALLTKAAIAQRHADACGIHGDLSTADILLMHLIYQKKYSKMKNMAKGE